MIHILDFGITLSYVPKYFDYSKYKTSGLNITKRVFKLSNLELSKDNVIVCIDNLA